MSLQGSYMTEQPVEEGARTDTCNLSPVSHFRGIAWHFGVQCFSSMCLSCPAYRDPRNSEVHYPFPGSPYLFHFFSQKPSASVRWQIRKQQGNHETCTKAFACRKTSAPNPAESEAISWLLLWENQVNPNEQSSCSSSTALWAQQEQWRIIFLSAFCQKTMLQYSLWWSCWTGTHSQPSIGANVRPLAPTKHHSSS